ncbi:SRPBCC family protein [Promicromonospora sp. NPDC057138]|uniref:SRPBCC family protein n=1 Tax=Promicromonospora sp. NPDC057138 TaxID=3346031 RepID=UPI003636F66D
MSNKSPVAPEKAPGLSPVASSLKDSLGGLAHALGGRAVDKVAEKTGGLTQRLTDYAEGRPSPGTAAAAKGAKEMVDKGSPLKAGLAGAATGVKQVFTNIKESATGLKDTATNIKESATGVTDKVKDALGGRGDGNSGFKFNNIVEAIDVGAPVDIVFDAWTEYDRWPEFMKKVEHAELDPDEGTVSFQGQVFWSHRQWDATIVDQVPGRRIVWDSTGPKGHLSGVVTFHSLAEELTRIVLVVEYHPGGFVEKTANIWRAVNRRLRLELKQFVRYVMTDVMLDPDDLEGYRAEIQDGEVIRTHDEVLEEESSQAESEEEEPYDEESEDEEVPQEAPSPAR